MQRSVTITFQGALGDIVASTAMVRDLKRANPDLAINVDVPFPEVYHHNPYLTAVAGKPDTVLAISEADYRQAVQRSQLGLRRHFIEWFHDIAARSLGMPCPLTEAKPDLHLSGRSANLPALPERYWVIFAGGKPDITLKHWSFDRYQEVASQLLGRGINLVQTGRSQDIHPPLHGVTDLVGYGGPRELFELIAGSCGVICPVTCGMHIAAAFEKPCVVLAGGREEVWWAGYCNSTGAFAGVSVKTPHCFLHSIGTLDCCATSGCWKRRLWGSGPDACTNRVQNTREVLPACLNQITVRTVVDAVLSYEGAS